MIALADLGGARPARAPPFAWHPSSLADLGGAPGVRPPHLPGILVFRWFKFTLKPPYSIAHDKLRLAIWDTSFWTFWLKFGHKGP